MPIAEVLAEHYQKTYELTLAMWEQRNRTFLMLLGVVGVATLLTFEVSQAQPLLADLIAKTFGIEDAARLKELRASFPYGLIQSILILVVFYLMVILCHRTTSINRHYRYLESLEFEIRQALGVADSAVAFSREGTFFWKNRTRSLNIVAIAYVFMLGGLLVAFLGMRVCDDVRSGKTAFALIDVGLSAGIALFFFAYAVDSLGLFRNGEWQFRKKKTPKKA